MVLDSFQGSVPQNRPFVSVVSPDLKISYRETSLSFFVGCLANEAGATEIWGKQLRLNKDCQTLTAGCRDINYEDSEQVIHIII